MSGADNIKIGLFIGSDTGNTETIGNDFVEEWDFCPIELIQGYDMTPAHYEEYDYIIIGLSTWYDGELQSDFEGFFDEFKTIDFTGKTVAMFGLGDQYGYAEYFVDGLGILGEVIIENGGKIIGMVSTEGYEYQESKGLFNDDTFYGLPLDEDNQMVLTAERIEKWIKQVEQEIRQHVAK